MKTENESVKEMVKERYAAIAIQSKETNMSSCCGAGSCSDEIYNIMSDDYSTLEGYQPEADLGLGCGLPTQFALIKKGDTVVDLGSGAGNDCFVARQETGASGKVIGIDFTEAMVKKAKENALKVGFTNVEFLQGDIENIPLTAETANVVVSNCVLNLVPDKEKAFNEIYRILKPGGHFSISDVVLIGELPAKLLSVAEMYAGCVAGAIAKDRYLQMIGAAGFSDIKIQKEKVIRLPDDILSQYLSPSEIEDFKNSGTGIYSITVFGKKAKSCCGPDCC